MECKTAYLQDFTPEDIAGDDRNTIIVPSGEEKVEGSVPCKLACWEIKAKQPRWCRHCVQ